MNYPKPTSLRLNRALVQLGLAASRRKADELIISSKVKVNGKVVTKLATTVVLGTDIVMAAGKIGDQISNETIILVLNKPVGYVCSHNPQGNDRSIFALLPHKYSNLKIAGRLDKDSEGLVLLTNDGDLANHMSHPRYQKSKQYEVTINQPISASQLELLTNGIKLHDGLSKFDEIQQVKSHNLIVTLHEGRNRQIRRTFSAVDLTVTRLRRTMLGNISLDKIPSGKFRKLDTIEL